MFRFKGISNEEMNIVVEEELNFSRKSLTKYNVTEIPGKNGNIYEEAGFSDIEIPLRLQLLDIKKLDDICAWLQGTGLLEYQDKVSTASFFSEEVPTRFGSIYTLDVTLIRKPFWYKKQDDFVVVDETIINEGNVYAEPLLRIERVSSQKVDITINEIRFTYDFRDEDYVEIDCETGNAFWNGLNRNLYIEIGFLLPVLKVGENIFNKNDCDCIVKVKRKDRYR